MLWWNYTQLSSEMFNACKHFQTIIRSKSNRFSPWRHACQHRLRQHMPGTKLNHKLIEEHVSCRDIKVDIMDIIEDSRHSLRNKASMNCQWSSVIKITQVKQLLTGFVESIKHNNLSHHHFILLYIYIVNDNLTCWMPSLKFQKIGVFGWKFTLQCPTWNFVVTFNWRIN